MIYSLGKALSDKKENGVLNSNLRKRVLSGWFKSNYPTCFASPLKLQKFLFLYEAFCKAEALTSDFDRLQGYVNGTVYGTVYGDYMYEHHDFVVSIQDAYSSNKELVNERLAKMAGFIVATRSEKELSELTHEFNIWKEKEPRILSGEKKVELEEKDFNGEDYILTQGFIQYAEDYIDENYVVINMGLRYFLLTPEAYGCISPEQMDALYEVSQNTFETDGLQNPIFVELDDEDGGIILE